MLRGRDPDVRDHSLASELLTSGGEWRAVVTSTHKLIVNVSGATQLYDLEKDAYEMKNLAGEKSAAALPEDWSAQMKRGAKATDDLYPKTSPAAEENYPDGQAAKARAGSPGGNWHRRQEAGKSRSGGFRRHALAGTGKAPASDDFPKPPALSERRTGREGRLKTFRLCPHESGDHFDQGYSVVGRTRPKHIAACHSSHYTRPDRYRVVGLKCTSV